MIINLKYVNATGRSLEPIIERGIKIRHVSSDKMETRERVQADGILFLEKSLRIRVRKDIFS
jgi:hypothetical protein